MLKRFKFTESVEKKSHSSLAEVLAGLSVTTDDVDGWFNVIVGLLSSRPNRSQTEHWQKLYVAQIEQLSSVRYVFHQDMKCEHAAVEVNRRYILEEHTELCVRPRTYRAFKH